MESITKSRNEIVTEIILFISSYECVSHFRFEDDLVTIHIHPLKTEKISGFVVSRLSDICEKYALSQMDILSDSNVPYIKIQLVR